MVSWMNVQKAVQCLASVGVIIILQCQVWWEHPATQCCSSLHSLSTLVNNNLWSFNHSQQTMMHSFHFSKQVFCKQGLCKCVTGDCQYDCDYANIVLIIHISDELALLSILFIDEDCHQLTWLTSRKPQSDSTPPTNFLSAPSQIAKSYSGWAVLLMLSPVVAVGADVGLLLTATATHGRAVHSNLLSPQL